MGHADHGLRYALTACAWRRSRVEEIEHAAIRAYLVDWKKDGTPAHTCAGNCDDYTRDLLGCGLRSRSRGHGRAISYCPGWMRQTLLWQEIADLLDSGATPDLGGPHKLLRALRLAAVYRAERLEDINGRR